MRRPSIFKKRDVIRAIAAVRDAGLEVDHVEISRDGLIVIVPAKPTK